MQKAIFIVLISLVVLLVCAGCNVFGFLASPAPYDRILPAEFKIKDRAKEKVLVVVDQSGGISTGLFASSDLKDAISVMLVKRAGVKNKYLVNLSAGEGGSVGGLGFSPAKAGADAGAGLVLYTRILDYKLYPSGPEGYYIGRLYTGSVVLDSKTEKVVWPIDGRAKIIKMEVGIESRGQQETIDKLITSTAHGISRYLYDIRYPKFKTSLEKVPY